MWGPKFKIRSGSLRPIPKTKVKAQISLSNLVVLVITPTTNKIRLYIQWYVIFFLIDERTSSITKKKSTLFSLSRLFHSRRIYIKINYIYYLIILCY